MNVSSLPSGFINILAVEFEDALDNYYVSKVAYHGGHFIVQPPNDRSVGVISVTNVTLIAIITRVSERYEGKVLDFGITSVTCHLRYNSGEVARPTP